MLFVLQAKPQIYRAAVEASSSKLPWLHACDACSQADDNKPLLGFALHEKKAEPTLHQIGQRERLCICITFNVAFFGDVE